MAMPVIVDSGVAHGSVNRAKMEDDLELEGEGTSSGSAAQPVRRNISLKLKAKAKPVSLSSSPSAVLKNKKKESKHREKKSAGDVEQEIRKKQKSPVSPGQVLKELKWDHKIFPLGQKVQDPLLHLCEKCSLPILVYGRLSPCKHSFCLSCANKGNGKCPRCGDSVQRIERAPLGSVFVCSFGGSRYGISGCRRSYFSQKDLQSHIKRRHQREQSGGDSDGGGEEHESDAKRAMIPGHFFVGLTREGLPGVPTLGHPLYPGERPFGSVPVMDSRHLVGVPNVPRDPFFMEGPRPQRPPVSGFPVQMPAQVQVPTPAAMQPVRPATFMLPEQAPHPRFEDLRGPRSMGPSPVDPPEGFAPRPGGPAFPGRFPGPETDVRPANWPPRSEADWIPPDRGPPVRAERDWIAPQARTERDWMPPRGEGANWVGPGRPLPSADPHFRPPMF